MEWKNYLSLDKNEEINDNYLLNINENYEPSYESYNMENSKNINFLNKYTDNDLIDNQDDESEKMNYFNLLNNTKNSSPEFNNMENIDDNYYFSPESQDKKNEINLMHDIDYEEEEKKINKLNSDSSNNDTNKDLIKKNLFKIQSFSSMTKEDSKNKDFSLSEDNNKDNISNTNSNSSNINNSSTNIIFNNYIPNLPLKQRMKIKKEKTKKLLENKTHRTEEESKDNFTEKNYINFLNKDSQMQKLSKKEIKMLRNRLSAQRSRDRKKKELLDLKAITKTLLQENEKLRNEIKSRDDKINKLLNILCPQCKSKLDNNNILTSPQTQLTTSSIIGGKKKLALLMTGLFTIFCVFGNLMNPGESNLLRNMKEKNITKNNNFDGEKRVNVPFLIEKDYTIRHQKEIEMYQKIKKNNLKNKNLMVPASLFHNNSEQIISNINNKTNHENENHNNDNDKINDEKNQNNNNNVGNDDKGKFLGNGKIKIIEKEYSNKGNNDIKKDENFKDN